MAFTSNAPKSTLYGYTVQSKNGSRQLYEVPPTDIGSRSAQPGPQVLRVPSRIPDEVQSTSAPYMQPYWNPAPQPVQPQAVLQGPLAQQEPVSIPAQFTLPWMSGFGNFGYNSYYDYHNYYHNYYPRRYSKSSKSAPIIIVQEGNESPKKRTKHHYYGPSGEKLPGAPRDIGLLGNTLLHSNTTMPFGNTVLPWQSYPQPAAKPVENEITQLPPIHQNFTVRATLEYGQISSVLVGDSSKLPELIIQELQQKYAQHPKTDVTITAVNGQFSIKGTPTVVPGNQQDGSWYIMQKYLSQLETMLDKNKKAKKKKKRKAPSE